MGRSFTDDLIYSANRKGLAYMIDIVALRWRSTILRWTVYGVAANTVAWITIIILIAAHDALDEFQPIPGVLFQLIGTGVVGALLGLVVRASCTLSRASVAAAVVGRLAVFAAFPAYLAAMGAWHDSPSLLCMFTVFGVVGFGLALLDLRRYRSAHATVRAA